MQIVGENPAKYQHQQEGDQYRLDARMNRGFVGKRDQGGAGYSENDGGNDECEQTAAYGP